MARYFFNSVDDGHFRDLEGMELPDHAAARVEAIRLAGQLLADTPAYLSDGHDFRVEVSDRDGTHLFTIVALAIDTTAGGAPIGERASRA